MPRLPSAFLDQGRHDLRGYQAAAAPVVRGHLADHQPQEGIASTTLAKDLKITQKSAWFVLHRLRYAARTRSFNRPLGSEVELDESYFGGRETNKHAHKRQPPNSGPAADKRIVFGMLQRRIAGEDEQGHAGSHGALRPHLTLRYRQRIERTQRRANRYQQRHVLQRQALRSSGCSRCVYGNQASRPQSQPANDCRVQQRDTRPSIKPTPRAAPANHIRTTLCRPDGTCLNSY